MEKTLASSLDSKIKSVNSKGNQPWLFIRIVIHWKGWCWSWSSNTLATWYEEPTHWEKSWFWERLRAREGDSRGWDGWMTSLTQWTRVWVNSRSWWWTRRPGVLQSMGLQRLSDWTELKVILFNTNALVGTSLVVWWFTIHLPVQGTWIPSLIQEDSTYHRAALA